MNAFDEQLAQWTPDRCYLQAQSDANQGRLPRPVEASPEQRALVELLFEIERAAMRGGRLPARLANGTAARALRVYRTRSRAVVIEALILARCNLPLIQALSGLNLAIIDAYRRYFFDVAGHLDRPQTILDEAISRELLREGNLNPVRHAAMKCIAYYCGVAPFLELYGIDRRHSSKVWTLPTTLLKKAKLAARIDAVVELLASGVTSRALDLDSVGEQFREVLGDDFPAFPLSSGLVDFVPRLEGEKHFQFLAGIQRAK